MSSCRGPLPQAVQDLCDLTFGLWAVEGEPPEAESAEAAAVPRGRALEEALQQATWADGSAVLKLLGAVEGEEFHAPSPPVSQVPSAPLPQPPCASQLRSVGGASALDKSEILDLDLSAGGMVPRHGGHAAWEKCVRDDCLDKVTTMGSLPTFAAPTRDSLPWTAMTRDSLPWAAMTRDSLPSAANGFNHDMFLNDASGFSAASWDRARVPKDASGYSLTSSMSMPGLRGGRSPTSLPTGSATFGDVVHM